MKFFQIGDFVVAERKTTGQKYTLRPWQYELLALLNGTVTFRDASKSIYSQHPGTFTTSGLLNFYRWLYDENLVACVCDSIYQLAPETESPLTLSLHDAPDAESKLNENTSFFVPDETASQKPLSFPNLEDQVAFELWDDSDEEGALSENDYPDPIEAFERDGWIEGFLETTGKIIHKPAIRRSLMIAAGLAFLLSVIRIAQVTSPLFEPVGQRLAIMFLPKSEAVTAVASERTAASPTVDRVAPAARVDESMKEQAQAQAQPQPAPSANTRSSGELPSTQDAPQTPAMNPQTQTLGRITTLRAQLEECRIRRDEYYLQNDEAGYRREVHRMTSLANEIGEIENGL